MNVLKLEKIKHKSSGRYSDKHWAVFGRIMAICSGFVMLGISFAFWFPDPTVILRLWSMLFGVYLIYAALFR